MSELKREKRLNKNGVLVTKLVRGDIDQNGAAISALKAVVPTLGGAERRGAQEESSKSWNPLSALKDRKERKAHEREQRETLRDSFYGYVGFDKENVDYLVSSISKPENIDKALDLVEQFENFGGSRGERAVLDLMRTVDMDAVTDGESSGLRAMYAHRDYFDRNHSSVGMFGMGFMFLKERELDRQQEDGSVLALEKIVDSAYELGRAALKSGRKSVDVSEFFTEATRNAGLKQRAERASK
jgi:hypothetical protein